MHILHLIRFLYIILTEYLNENINLYFNYCGFIENKINKKIEFNFILNFNIVHLYWISKSLFFNAYNQSMLGKPNVCVKSDWNRIKFDVEYYLLMKRSEQ